MLSAVENFGPLVGPAVALSHHPHAVTHHLQAQHLQHTAQRGYALDIVAGTAADATVRVSAALSPTTTSIAGGVGNATVITTQAPLTHTQLTQLNALQALKLQQQIQQQYEQHLSTFLNASSQSSPITGLTVLPHRPQPVTALNEADASLAHKQQQQQQQHQQHQHYQLQQQQQQQEQQLRAQQSHIVNLMRTSNTPKFISSPHDTSAMMPLAEFTPPPKPSKHEQHARTLENGQSAAINLVTNASNAYASNTNCHQLVTNNNNNNHSSNSNPASIENRRSSSSSSSVDVENDESMSPVSNAPAQVGRKALEHTALHASGADSKQPAYSETSASSAAAAVVAAYQYNYSQLYGAGRPTGLYNAPVIFATHNPHISQHIVQQHPGVVHGGSHMPPSYVGALSTHSPAVSPGEGGIYPAEYLKALQNAVAGGVFQATPSHTTPVFQTSPLASSNATATTTTGVPKTRLCSPSAAGTNVAQAAINSPPSKGEQRTATTTKLSTGTYLYDKAKRTPPDTPADTEKFFKIPSGKEGSLKHRILTRPASIDKTAGATTAEAARAPIMRTHSSTSSFKKGSYIELANGSLRRVEDMRTEDFIQCAERSPHHQLIESTVVKISNHQPANTVIIGFSYDRNQSKVDMEIAADHPFFVYGQGWASCNPESTLKSYGLKCQRLQVGDICISLTKREPPNINIKNNNNINNNNNNNNSSNSNKHTYLCDASTARITTNETHGLENDLQPLILNDNIYATHLKGANVVCPPNTQYPPPMLRSPLGTMHFLPPHLLTNTPTHPGYAPADRYARFTFHASHTQAAPSMHAGRVPHSDTSPSAATSPAHQSLSVNARQEEREQQQSAEAAAASARKRRWSAPESFSNSEDEDEEAAGGYKPPLRQKSAPTAAVSCNFKPYLPTTQMSKATATSTAATAAGQFNCDFSTNNK